MKLFQAFIHKPKSFESTRGTLYKVYIVNTHKKYNTHSTNLLFYLFYTAQQALLLRSSKLPLGFYLITCCYLLEMLQWFSSTKNKISIIKPVGSKAFSYFRIVFGCISKVCPKSFFFCKRDSLRNSGSDRNGNEQRYLQI